MNITKEVNLTAEPSTIGDLIIGLAVLTDSIAHSDPFTFRASGVNEMYK